MGERTVSGLNKAALLKNKRGKVMGKKQNAAGKRAYKNIQSWTNAVKAARKELGARLRGGQREDPAGQGHLREGQGTLRCQEVRALLKTEPAGAVAPFVVLPRGIPRSGR